MIRAVVGSGTGAQLYCKIFCSHPGSDKILLPGQDLVEIIDFGVPETRKIAKWMLLERPQHPQNPKLCGKRSISITFLTKKKYIFLAKIIFRNIFDIFRLIKARVFAI